MDKLKEIKSEAQKLLAENKMESVTQFLYIQLENEDQNLYNNATMFRVKLNKLNRDKKEQLITNEELVISQSKLRLALIDFIQSLDNPDNPYLKEIHSRSLSKKQLMKLIFLFQIFILIGIGILIYLQLR